MGGGDIGMTGAVPSGLRPPVPSSVAPIGMPTLPVGDREPVPPNNDADPSPPNDDPAPIPPATPPDLRGGGGEHQHLDHRCFDR